MLRSDQGEKLGKGLSLEGVRDGLPGSTLVQVPGRRGTWFCAMFSPVCCGFCVTRVKGASVVREALMYVVALAEAHYSIEPHVLTCCVCFGS